MWSAEQLYLHCRSHICHQQADLIWSAEQLYMRCTSGFCDQQAGCDVIRCTCPALQIISLGSPSIDADFEQAVLLL